MLSTLHSFFSSTHSIVNTTRIDSSYLSWIGNTHLDYHHECQRLCSHEGKTIVCPRNVIYSDGQKVVQIKTHNSMLHIYIDLSLRRQWPLPPKLPPEVTGVAD